MTVKYIHIRPGVRYDADAKRLVGEPLAKGGVTIAFELLEGDDEVPGSFRVALAQCNPKDSYSRSRGRQIALGRLLGHKWLLQLAHDPSRGVFEQVVDEVGTYLEYCSAPLPHEACR